VRELLGRLGVEKEKDGEIVCFNLAVTHRLSKEVGSGELCST